MTAPERLKILIAEDDSVSRLILERCLKKLGADYIVARDGLEAWALFESNPIDVVISDWMMPGMDGLALCRRIREATDRSYPYFIMLTALSEKQSFITGMEAGADDYLTKPLDWEDLQARLIAASRVTTLHRRLATQAAAMERLNAQLFEEGRTDPLTRLRNRLCLHEDLRGLTDSVGRYGHTFGVAMCDIDYYKRFNDHYGHIAGDEVLVQVAAAMKSAVRPGDTVYRYGGEEFLIVLPEQTLAGAATALARVRERVVDLEIAHEKSPLGMVSLSIGVSCVAPDSAASFDEALRQADVALYHAKETGRNRIVAYSDGVCAEPVDAAGTSAC